MHVASGKSKAKERKQEITYICSHSFSIFENRDKRSLNFDFIQMDLRNKVVVITGASVGIGKAAVLAFAKAGGMERKQYQNQRIFPRIYQNGFKARITDR